MKIRLLAKGMGLLVLSVVLMSSLSAIAQEKSTEEGWITLFNGQNLDGWTPKITGYPLGENFGNTFRVEDGLLKVRYDQYDKFNKRYGHLFFKEKFSHYKLRVEYRFVGEQISGGEGWALRNSGIMIHGQSPDSMTIGQDFPVSIEVQLLGGDGKNDRSTGNLCTPGTNVVIDGQLITQHCTNSRSKTYHGEQWVTAELEVHGNGLIKHLINGEVVFEYEQSQLDDRDANAKKLLDMGVEKMLSEGTISLQSESHPCDFRKVEILPLKE